MTDYQKREEIYKAAKANGIVLPDEFLDPGEEFYSEGCHQEAEKIYEAMRGVIRGEISAPASFFAKLFGKNYKKDMVALADMRVTIGDPAKGFAKKEGISRERAKIGAKYTIANPQNDAVRNVINLIDLTIEGTKVIPGLVPKVQQGLTEQAIEKLKGMKETISTYIMDGYSFNANQCAQKVANSIYTWRKQCSTGMALNLSSLVEAEQGIEEWRTCTTVPMGSNRATDETRVQAGETDRFASARKVAGVNEQATRFFEVIEERSKERITYDSYVANREDTLRRYEALEAEEEQILAAVHNGELSEDAAIVRLDAITAEKEQLDNEYASWEEKIATIEGDVLDMENIINEYSVLRTYYEHFLERDWNQFVELFEAGENMNYEAFIDLLYATNDPEALPTVLGMITAASKTCQQRAERMGVANEALRARAEERRKATLGNRASSIAARREADMVKTNEQRASLSARPSIADAKKNNLRERLAAKFGDAAPVTNKPTTVENKPTAVENNPVEDPILAIGNDN